MIRPALLIISVFSNFFVSHLSQAQDTKLPRALSRAIMPSCEFVYRVELDLAIAFPVDPFVFAGDSGEKSIVQLKFSDAWHPEKPELIVSLERYKDTDWYTGSFLSMSVSDSHLYRIAKFRKGHFNAENEFVADSAEYTADFGRQFGERCYQDRNPDNSFFEREVKIVDPLSGLSTSLITGPPLSLISKFLTNYLRLASTKQEY